MPGSAARVLALVVLFCTSPVAATAQREGKPPPRSRLPAVSFAARDTLRLDVEELEAHRRVVLGSGATRDLPVRLRIEDADERFPLSRVLAADTGVVVLRPGANTLLLSLRDFATVPTGSYRGDVVVRDTASKQLARRPVEVSVALPPAHPTESEWTTEVYRAALFPEWRAELGWFERGAVRCAPSRVERSALGRIFFGLAGTCIRDNVVPVPEDSLRKVAASSRSVIGVLAHTDTAWKDLGFVTWTGEQPPLTPDGKGRGVELDFTSFDYPGVYRGRIDLAPGARGGEVDVSVRVTHALLFPFLAIFLGVLLSSLLRRYLRVKRALLQLQEDTSRVMARFGAVREEFLRSVGETPAAGYGVEESLRARVQQLEESIRGLRRSSNALEKGNEAYDRVVAELDACRKQVEEWPGFGRQLASLARALDTANAELAGEQPPGRSRTGAPEGFTRAGELLRGRPLRMDEVEARMAEVQKADAFVREWRRLNRRALLLKTRIRALQTGPRRPLTDGEAATLASVEKKFVGAWVELWDAEDSEALGLNRTRDDLNAAYGGIEPLLSLLPDGEVRQEAEEAGEGGSGVLLAAGGGERSGEREEDRPEGPWQQKTYSVPLTRTRVLHWQWPVIAEVRAGESRTTAESRNRRVSGAIRRQELAYGALTLGVAALTGLNELYFDKPFFGTAHDYVLAILWGFGTRLGFDVVRSTLENGRLPWPLSRGGAPGGGGGS